MRKILNILLIATAAIMATSCNNSAKKSAEASASQQASAEASATAQDDAEKWEQSRDAGLAGKVIEAGPDVLIEAVGDLTETGWKNSGKRPAVIDFNATWCGPCKQLKPVLEKLAAQYKGKVDFYSIDVDQSPELASTLGIESIPYVIVAPVGKAPHAIVGFDSADAFSKQVQQYLQ